MRMTLLFTAVVATCASSAYAADTPPLQAQPLAMAPGAGTAAKPAFAGNAVSSPKLTAAIATRNDDGTLEVGCVDKPNPRAGKAPTRTPLPEAQ
ncbi:MAG: hypothetical protein JSS16_04235 [Proteobacteria bacterium]|nr:hypothetical protein [Pseudomonadota bacterium]